MPYIDWMGKSDVINHHKKIPYKTIECVKRQQVMKIVKYDYKRG